MNKMQDLPLCDLNEVKRTAKRTDSDISGCKFSGEYLESEDLSCLSFINCMFENCTFTDCDFERSSFVDVTFISCDLSNSSLDSSYLSRCEFRSCKLVGAEFKDCSIQGVTFESSNCGYAIFDKCKLSETQVKTVICPPLSLFPAISKHSRPAAANTLAHHFSERLSAALIFLPVL